MRHPALTRRLSARRWSQHRPIIHGDHGRELHWLPSDCRNRLLAMATVGRVEMWRGGPVWHAVGRIDRCPASNRARDSVSTSRSSNRTCRFPASGSRTRLHAFVPRLVAPKCGEAYESEVPIQVREWIAPAPTSPHFVLVTQPPA